MSEYKRLTIRSPRNNMAYLVNVKESEQEVESPYPNTLRCIMDSFERLAQYEDSGLSPEEVSELAKAKEEGTLVDKKKLNARIKECIEDWKRFRKEYANGSISLNETCEIRIDVFEFIAFWLNKGEFDYEVVLN